MNTHAKFNIRVILLALILGFTGLLAAMSLAWGTAHGLQSGSDLMLRWEESRLFVRGENPYVLKDMTYPPSSLVVYAPVIAPWDRDQVKLVWYVANLAACVTMIAVVLRLWGRHWPMWTQAAFVLVVLACRPVRAGLAMGQFQLIPMAFLFLAVACQHRGKLIAAGGLFALGLAKPTMLVPFYGYFAARRQTRIIAISIIAHIAAWLGVALWLNANPFALVQSWLHNARSQLGEGTIDIPTFLIMLLPQAKSFAMPLALVICGAGFLAAVRNHRADDLTILGFCGFISTIFTYHRHYDMILLLPAMVLAWDSAIRSGSRVQTILAGVFAFFLISPSTPSLLGSLEYVQIIGFIGFAYLALMLNIIVMRRQHNRNTATIEEQPITDPVRERKTRTTESREIAPCAT